MKPYLGVLTTKSEMLQMGYREAMEFYAECGITTLVVGGGAPHLEYYKHLRYPIQAPGEEASPTLKETCKIAEDIGLDIEVAYGLPGLQVTYPETAVVDVLGNRSTLRTCQSNPDVLAYTLATIRDILENYHTLFGLEFDGLYIDMHQRMTNRRGQPPAFYPLHHIAPESCFCEHCRRIAKEEGVDMERIEKTVKESTKLSMEPSTKVFYDIFDTFRGQYDMVRYLLRRPELMEWLNLRCVIAERAFKEVHETIKAVDPKFINSQDMLPPTWSWSLAQDYARHKPYSDQFKIIFFNKRTGSYEVNPLITIKDNVPDVPDEDIMEIFKRLVGYEGPTSFTAFSQQGFPPVNVYYELKKARDEVGPNHTLIAGIVGDAPVTPDDVEAAITMAAKGGANGFILHTWYGGATPSNYSAFGNKGRELAKPL